MQKTISQLLGLGIPQRLIKVPVTVVCTGLSLATAGSALAQVEPGRQANPPFSITYGGKRSVTKETQVEKEPKAGSAPDVSARDETAAASRSLQDNQARAATPLAPADTDRMDRLTSRLVAQSRDAWLRGLLDQASYSAWLDIAATTQLQIAQHQGDERGAVRVLRDQVSLWDEAATQLQQFDQPASHGWRADLSHARLMTLRAKFRYTVATGRSAGPLDQRAYANLAREHFELRREEFETRRGTAVDFLAAARMVDEQLVVPDEQSAADEQSLSLASFEVDRPVALRQSIEDVQQPVYLLGFPVVIEAHDPFEDIAATRRAARFVQFLETPTDSRNPQHLLELLNQNAGEVAAEQFARCRIGTATPGRMLQQWWQHETLAASVIADVPESPFIESQTQRLEQIHGLATALRDRRGRNAADVTAAETLWAARQLDLTRPVPKKEAPKPAANPAVSSVITFGQAGQISKAE